MGTVEFLYLDQEAVLGADALDMRRAIKVVGEAQARFATGAVENRLKSYCETQILRRAKIRAASMVWRHRSGLRSARPLA